MCPKRTKALLIDSNIEAVGLAHGCKRSEIIQEQNLIGICGGNHRFVCKPLEQTIVVVAPVRASGSPTGGRSNILKEISLSCSQNRSGVAFLCSGAWRWQPSWLLFKLSIGQSAENLHICHCGRYRRPARLRQWIEVARAPKHSNGDHSQVVSQIPDFDTSY